MAPRSPEAINSSKKITLVFPRLLKESTAWAPLPLMAVAAPLIEAGFEAEIIDGRIIHPHMPRILEAAADSLYVGLSVMTGYQIRDAVAISRAVKAAHPGVPVVWGGYHASMLPEQTLAEPYIDYVIRGQGQIAATELARRLQAGEVPGGDMPGLCFRKDGASHISSYPKLVDIDQFPPTPYDIIDIEKYMVDDIGSRTMKYFSSQGCPFGCGFCAETAMYGINWVGFSEQRVVDDLENLVKRYGVNAIDFADTNFFVSKKRTRAICEGIIERGLDITWAADVRTKQFLEYPADLQQLIYDAGCRRLLLGAESGSQEALKNINKQTTVEDTLAVSRRCDELGITARFTTMFGFPGAPEQDIEATLKMIEEIKRINETFEVHGFFFAPYPGAPMYDESVKLGFVPPERLEDWADFDLTELHTPWVDPRYKEKVDMVIDFYMLFASPGPELKRKMRAGGLRGLVYRLLHRLASWRVSHRNFSLPVEWWLKKRRAARRPGAA